MLALSTVPSLIVIGTLHMLTLAWAVDAASAAATTASASARASMPVMRAPPWVAPALGPLQARRLPWVPRVVAPTTMLLISPPPAGARLGAHPDKNANISEQTSSLCHKLRLTPLTFGGVCSYMCAAERIRDRGQSAPG